AVQTLVLRTLPILMLIRIAWLRPFHLHKDLWQYVAFKDLGGIIGATLLGSATFAALVGFAQLGYPRPLLVLDALLCVAALAGMRMVRRAHHELRSKVLTARRVLVV